MRFGCYTELDKMRIVQDAGYDYIELPVSLVKAEAPDAEFDAVWEEIGSHDIVPEVWSRLLPRDMQVTGPEVELYRVERYLRTAFERIEELGGEIVVFGSGGARRVPDGFPMDEAREQIVEFVTLAGQIAGTYGLTIAVEPLGIKETNIVNSVGDATELVRSVDHPFVKVIADLHHMFEMSEPVGAVIDAGNELVHTHVADGGRLYPGSGGYPVREFIETLHSIGYNSRMTIECDFRDFTGECAKALDFLRGLDEETPF